MKIYDSLTTQLYTQLNGNKTLLILKGPKEENELAFNGLFNFGATESRELNKIDENTCYCWSSPLLIQRFWYNQHFLKFDNHRLALIYATRKTAETLADTRDILKLSSPMEDKYIDDFKACVA